MSQTSEARPVSYPGGWTVMQMNDDDMNSLHVHYSPTSKYSIGYMTADWRADRYQTHSLQLNNLLKRFNQNDSQANFYLKSGVGVAYDYTNDRPDRTQPHFYSGLAMDWENRRFFTQYENSFHHAGNYNQEFSEFIHLGITPYIGEYGDLHTWLMVKIKHEPKATDHFTVIPHVRFFKDVYMLEVGVTENKKLLLNWVIRF